MIYLSLVHLGGSPYSHAGPCNASAQMRCYCCIRVPSNTTNTSPFKIPEIRRKKLEQEQSFVVYYISYYYYVHTLLGEIRSKCSQTGENLLFVAGFIAKEVWVNRKYAHNSSPKSTKCEGESIAFRCPFYFESHAKPANHFLNQSRGTAGSRGFERHHIRHQHKPRYALHKNLPRLLGTRFEASARKDTSLT